MTAAEILEKKYRAEIEALKKENARLTGIIEGVIEYLEGMKK